MKSFTQLGKARQRNGAKKNCEKTRREKWEKRRKKKLLQSLLAPAELNWVAIATYSATLWTKGTTKALAQTTLFAAPCVAALPLPLTPPPAHTSYTYAAPQSVRVCLRRGLRTFNNAQSDFFRIINLTRVRDELTHMREREASKGRHSKKRGVGRCHCQSRCHLTVKWTHAWRLQPAMFSLRESSVNLQQLQELRGISTPSYLRSSRAARTNWARAGSWAGLG